LEGDWSEGRNQGVFHSGSSHERQQAVRMFLRAFAFMAMSDVPFVRSVNILNMTEILPLMKPCMKINTPGNKTREQDAASHPKG
jgi:hypothetical protein